MSETAARVTQDQAHTHTKAVTQSAQRQTDGAGREFSDQRPIAQMQRSMQELANNSPQAMQLRSLQQLADNRQGSWHLPVNADTDDTRTRAPLQRQAEGATFGAATVQTQAAPASPNRTGLPDQLKAGVENLSGMSLDHVKVHYNSSQPAQMQAHAYAQGSDIHVAPGQEQHLPHEAWHVVQQMQGRVQATTQLKQGVPVNDDAGLENEADVMGARALAKGVMQKGAALDSANGGIPNASGHTVQRKQSVPEVKAPGNYIVQFGRVKAKRRKSKKKANTRYGGCTFNKIPLTVKNAVFFERPPSNSRRGQGDHIVSYSLITEAVASSVVGKSLDQAGSDLAGLVTDSKNFVGPGAINKWWHTHADNLVVKLNAIDQGANASKAQSAIQSGINDTLALLNMMPGTAMKNKASTKGHGEGGSKGGLGQGERDVKKGKTLKGNVWVNVLNLFDGAADKSLLESPDKLESKLNWLMTLFSHAAPTLYDLVETKDLTLIPDTDLGKAVGDKFAILTALEVQSVIETFLGH